MREHVDVTDLRTAPLHDLGADISYRKTPEISAPLAPQLRSETPQKRPRPLLWHLPSQRIVQAAAAAVIIAGVPLRGLTGGACRSRPSARFADQCHQACRARIG